MPQKQGGHRRKPMSVFLFHTATPHPNLSATIILYNIAKDQSKQRHDFGLAF